MTFASRLDSYARPTGDTDRHARILEAAQRAFVRMGFHAASMQAVAEEAGMSAGNLYRYFPSKEALVEGLCYHDHNQRAADFLALASRTDVVDALIQTMRTNVLDAPIEKARLVLEIWAEAARNPRVAQMTHDFDAAAFEGLSMLIDECRSRGALPATLQTDFVARMLLTLAAGAFRRLAIESLFDRAREANYVIATVRSLLSGAISPPDMETK